MKLKPTTYKTKSSYINKKHKPVPEISSDEERRDYSDYDDCYDAWEDFYEIEETQKQLKTKIAPKILEELKKKMLKHNRLRFISKNAIRS